MKFLVLSLMLYLADGVSNVGVVHGDMIGCALKNYAVKCWGRGDHGALGLGHKGTQGTPADVDVGSDFLVSQLMCGNYHCCIISTVKTMKCWGHGGYGNLGYGDTSTRGDGSGEMGDNLPVVNDYLPSNFIIAKMALSAGSTCVMSTEGVVVCFGHNAYAELGLGHTTNIGTSLDHMGDNLVPVDVGDFVPVDLFGNGHNFYVVSSDGRVKGWGGNWDGEVCIGSEEDLIGDSPGEMGNNLPVSMLGTDFVGQSVSGGYQAACALSTDGGVKCFGINDYTHIGLGYGNSNRVYGNTLVGDNLPYVDLGTSFIAKELSASGRTVCAMNYEGDIKCWGRCYKGACGYESNNNIGNGDNQMGDFLPAVDVGSGFNASEIHLGEGMGDLFYCIYEDTPTELLAKCWGFGQYSQLGYGDGANKGDEAGEMGNGLPFIDFGEWPIVTTSAPTSAQPTTSPTAEPTVSPTDPVCYAEDMTSVNWHDLLNSDEQETSLLQSYAVDFDPSTLSLTLKATVQYVGQSADGNFDDDFNLGTTYWMDFQSFSTIDGGVDSAGSCGNRRSADYTDLSFEQFWEFPVNPADLDEMETAERMAYPPSEWDLEAINCTVIEYERTLSWTELTACSDADGDVLVEITETDDAVLLEGTFFVELVSPYSSTSDEYYRTFPLLQQGFRVALNREVNALSSTGVQLFIPSVMAYGLDDEGNYEVTVLVQSADYVMLGMDEESIASISSPLAVTGFETVNADCLVASSFTCGQIFTATIPASCSDEDSVIDLSGTYQFGFTPQCRILEDGSTEPACDVFMTTLDDAGKVVLEVDASFIDQCDVDLFEVTFDGNLAFFTDAEFSVAVDDGSDPFVIGQDTIYGKVTVDIPDDESGAMYDFVSVSIENVYVCTAEDELSVDDESGLGGCLSSDIVDDDGPYTVIGSGAVADYQGTTDFDVAANNEAAFSFLTFDTARTTINVHVQLLLTLTTESGEVRRRRMLLQSGSDGEDENGNAFRSYIGTASVAEEETTADPVGTDGGFARFSFGFIPAMWVVVIAFIMG